MSKIAKALAFAAVVAAGLIITAGAAQAAGAAHVDHGGIAPADPILIGDPPGDSTHNSTRTRVHNSGSGPAAVTAAGTTGQASQKAEQTRPDTSTHSYYQDGRRRINRTVSDSHNSSVYHDSHDTTSVQHPWGP